MIEEVPEAAETTVQDLATCTLNHSERDVQRLGKKFKLVLPIELTYVTISKGIEIPVLLMSSWFKFIMSMNLWYSLSGLDAPDDRRCKTQWSQFWESFEGIMPWHPIFNMARSGKVALERTAGLVVHGDEGRSRKKSAIMILSCHSVLGKGCGVKNRRGTLKTDYAKQDLNFLGNTWATRWLLGVLPKGFYDPKKGDAEAYDRLSQALVDDMNHTLETGVLSLDGELHWVVILYVIGDWPFHQKTFHLGRTFGSVAKQASSKTASKGICHNCLADQEGFPWEDFESPEPRWRSTVNTVLPFLEDPIFLQLPHDSNNPTSMIGLDIFHGFHLGAGKVFVASCLVLVSEQLPGSSVAKRFDSLHDVFFSWCSKRGKRPYIRKLSQETIKWLQTTDFPSGAWSKGSTTTCLLRFIIEFCRERENSLRGTLLHTCFLAACEADMFLSKLYKEGVWIPERKALEISRHGFDFLKFNGRVAYQAFREKRPLFPFMPNLHRVHEICFLLKDQAAVGYAANPLIWSTQMEEDFIGKPSRVSRRVSPRLAVTRTLQRSLMNAYSHFRAAGFIRD